jgi:hypothetical protein
MGKHVGSGFEYASANRPLSKRKVDKSRNAWYMIPK